MSERVVVGECRCPGAPHTEDWVELKPKLDVPMGIAAFAAIDASADPADIQGAVAGVFLRHGIIGWSFVDADGAPVPVTREAIERNIGWTTGGYDVAQAADALYAGDLFAPLAKRRQGPSLTSPTDASTSASHDSGAKLRTPSPRSSRNGSAGRPSAVLDL